MSNSGLKLDNEKLANKLEILANEIRNKNAPVRKLAEGSNKIVNGKTNKNLEIEFITEKEDLMDFSGSTVLSQVKKDE